MEEPPDLQAILDATWELYSAPTWADARRIVEQHPELLSTHFPEQILNELIENSHSAENEYDVNYFTIYRDLLRRAREVGIDTAFAELPSGPPPRSEAAAHEISSVPADLRDDLRRVMVADRRYQQGSPPQVLFEAADAWERIYRHLSLGDTEADFRWKFVNDGGALYLRCFFSMGQDEHLERALALLREAVALTSPDSQRYAASLHNLGRGLQAAYEHTATPDSLEEAIEAYERAVAATSPDSPGYAMYCGGLGSGLKTRYTWITGSRDDLDRAIQAYKLAVDYTATNSADLSAILNNWAIALEERYNNIGDMTDLDQSIEALEQAQAHPHNPSDSPGFSSNLGIGLLHRYDRTGAPNDLERAIEEFKRAVAETPSGSSALSHFLSGLAAAWKTRYERTGKLDDLDEAIRLWEQAVEHGQSRAPDFARLLTCLGNGLVDRHARNGDLQDLKRAISLMGQAARQTSPDSPEFPTFMNNLGRGLLDFYPQTGDETFLEGAVQAFEQVVAHTTPDASGYSGFMSNRGTAYWARYAATQQVKHLEAAIVSFEQAVEFTPHDSPELPGKLNNLANALVSRHHHTGKEVDLAAAIDKFEQSAVQGIEVHPESTLRAARSWGKWAFTRRAWNEAVNATTHGLKALEHLYSAQVLRQDRQSWQRDGQALAAMAAYALAQSNQLEQATVALESGRTRQLNESLARDRANLQAVREFEPALFEHYQSAAARLRRLEAVERQQQARQNDAAVPPYDWTAHRQQMREAESTLDAAIARIRDLPGYAHFLSQPDFTAVTAAAHPDNPLVYLVTTSAGSLALLIQQLGTASQPSAVTVEPIWADDFTEAELQAFLSKQEDGQLAGGYLPGQLGRSDWLHAALDEGLPLLGQRLMAPLANRLRTVGARCATLIPAGRLSLLPLHAARYTVNGKERTLCDEFTIAYAPSAQALAFGRQELAASRPAAPTLLAVCNPLPVPAGINPLRFAHFEVEQIAPCFHHHATLVGETDADYDTVVAYLPGSSYLHFSCHGLFDPEQPLASGLLLSHGQRLSLAAILGELSLRGVRLAVLSACQTAISDFNNVPDEVIGLPAGFLQAGVPGVVGSLWPVDDLSTALLMNRFYRLHLEKRLAPAIALRLAQCWLRDATARELAEWFEHRYDESGGTDRVTYEAALDLRSQFDLADRPYADPVYWAGFVYTGQ